MKIKKIFGAMAMSALIAGAPMTFTSCNEDDVNTIIDIINALVTTDDLNGTAWANPDYHENFIFYLVFSNGECLLQDANMMNSDGSGAREQRGTYTLDTQNSALTLTLDTGTRNFIITKFEKGQSMTLKEGNKTIDLVPYVQQ